LAVLEGKTPAVKDQPLFYIGAVQTFIFALQLFVFAYQAWKLRQTVEAGTQQSADMKESVKRKRLVNPIWRMAPGFGKS